MGAGVWQQVQSALQGNAPAGLPGHCGLPAGVVGGSHCSEPSTIPLPHTAAIVVLVTELEVVVTMVDVVVATMDFSAGTQNSRVPYRG